jgi:5-(carboxyamino)imidazole ribonucleotide synthase
VTCVGIVGGGQLGRMLALAGAPLGIRTVVLEPAPGAPAAVAADVIAAPFDDEAGLAELARRCDVVTIEVEHVPVPALAWLAERVPVHPSPEVVAVAQDRLAEKRLFTRLGIGTAPYAEPGELDAGHADGSILKRRTGGFDGRGQIRLAGGATVIELAAAAQELGAPSVVEGVVPFGRELSMVAARGVDGSTACYPLVENRHRDGILRETVAPATDAGRLTAEAERIVVQIMAELGLVGVLALELFEVDGVLLANELAPRVHNSGHWTIEGAVTSQFEQHLRAVCGWPLGEPAARGPSAMVNLIGGEPDARAVLSQAGAHLHRYGKEPRPGRKIGHITVVADGEEQRDQRLAAVRALVAPTAVG